MKRRLDVDFGCFDSRARHEGVLAVGCTPQVRQRVRTREHIRLGTFDEIEGERAAAPREWEAIRCHR